MANRVLKAYSVRMKVKYLDMFATEQGAGVENAKFASQFARHRQLKEHTFRNWVWREAQLRRELQEGPPKASCMLRRRRQFQGSIS